MFAKVIVINFFVVVLNLIVGFSIGHFYSREKFEKEYREGFKQGYSLGRIESEEE